LGLIARISMRKITHGRGGGGGGERERGLRGVAGCPSSKRAKSPKSGGLGARCRLTFSLWKGQGLNEGHGAKHSFPGTYPRGIGACYWEGKIPQNGRRGFRCQKGRTSLNRSETIPVNAGRCIMSLLRGSSLKATTDRDVWASIREGDGLQLASQIWRFQRGED